MHAYRADRVFDGEQLVPGGALVLVEDGRVLGVERRGADVPDGCDLTELPGTTLLPGLIDAHVHLCGDGGPRALDQLAELSSEQLDDVINEALNAQLAAGVTAVRDLGDIGYAAVGSRPGPFVVASGPPLTSVGGHCAVMGAEVAGVAQVRQAVREHFERGVDVVKIMTSGGAMTPASDVTACQFTLDELRAAVDEAHRHGLPITAHAHALPAVEQCVQAGVDGIEHCSCLTPTGLVTPPELIERIAATGIVVCPTLGRAFTGEPPPQIRAVMERTGMTWEGRLEQVGQLHGAGVRLISGVDAGINPGKPHGALPIAIADLVTCGVPVAQALASATSAAADGIGLGARKGRLRAGFDADLLFVAGDPLRDVTALRSVRKVVLHGVPV